MGLNSAIPGFTRANGGEVAQLVLVTEAMLTRLALGTASVDGVAAA